MNINLRRQLCLLFLLVLGHQALASEHVIDKALSACVACHTVVEPAEMNLDERLQRIGPSLFYAGNKYNAAWLEHWLQHPTRINPAGAYYGPHVVVTDDGDIVDKSTLSDHPVLDPQQAKIVTAALMALKPKSALIDQIDMGEVKAISRSMGALNFKKFKGCASCHQDAPGEGGLSGPELYTAYQRLQVPYLASYSHNPMLWEPRSLMPNQQFQHKDIAKLLSYLKTISEGQP